MDWFVCCLGDWFAIALGLTSSAPDCSPFLGHLVGRLEFPIGREIERES